MIVLQGEEGVKASYSIKSQVTRTTINASSSKWSLKQRFSECDKSENLLRFSLFSSLVEVADSNPTQMSKNLLHLSLF